MLKKARKMIKTAIGASLGGKSVRIKREDAAEKRIYNPDARLMQNDVIALDVTDDKGAMIWGKDGAFNNAIFVLATLHRGERTLENYHLFPSMLLRSAVKVKSRTHSADLRTPLYAKNEGLEDLLPGQTIVDFVEEMQFHTIEVVSISPETVWTLDFQKIEKNGKKVEELPRPIADEWWVSGETKFYTFEVEEMEDDATDADADATEADASTEEER